MKLTEEKIEEFRMLYLKEFGEKISKKEAFERAVSFLNLMKLAYKSFKSIEEYNSFLEWKKEQRVDDLRKMSKN